MMAALTRPWSRRALPQPNLVYYLWRFVFNGLRTFRALTTASSDPDVPVLARELTEQGIIVRPSDTFLSERGRLALAETTTAVLASSRSPEIEAAVSGAAASGDKHKDFVAHLVTYPSGIHPDDPILKVALDPKLLDIVAAYLGFWPSLYSIDAWLNYPTDAPPEVSQLWHRDPEDLRLVKAFIYLVDVGERCGPFTYVPRTHPFGAETVKSSRLEKKKRFEDDRMRRVFPPEAWRVCTGPANTMILADTLGYHRGGKPSVGRRILITFTYTSGTPMTERPIWVNGAPAWMASAMQRYAVTPLLGGPPPLQAPAKVKIKPPMS